MGNTVTHTNFTTNGEVRKAVRFFLRRTRLYWGLQRGVARRCRVNRASVSKAASSKQLGRYWRIEVALLEALAKFEPAAAHWARLWRESDRGDRRRAA